MALKLFKILSILFVFIFIGTALFDLLDVDFQRERLVVSKNARNSSGAFIEYYPNGNIASEEFYQDGLRYGRWRFYYPSGTIKEELVYEKGVLEGLQHYFSSSGRLIYTEVYRVGKLISENVVNDSLYRNEVRLIDNGRVLFDTHCAVCHSPNDAEVDQPFCVSRFLVDTLVRSTVFDSLMNLHADSLSVSPMDTSAFCWSPYEKKALLNYIDDLNKRIALHPSNLKSVKRVRILPIKKRI